MTTDDKPTQATILHVDMDAFFASVAEKDNPELKGKAVVIGMGTRGVVSAANYEARKFGIHSAMPVGQARRLAPHAIFLPVDMARYQEVSGHIMEIFESFTPNVEPVSVDEAFLDVTGAKKLLGTGPEIAAAIRAKVEAQEGITCSVGIAPSKFIAKLASTHCKPNGMLEITSDRILEFLHPLPISAMWGVGPKTAEVLERLGLRTIEDIAKLPRTTLIRAVGEAAGATLHELAWGRDYRDVAPQDAEKSISAAETFPTDLDNPEEILREYLRLCERATSRLRDKGLFAKTISIKVRFGDFTTINRSKTLPLPISAMWGVGPKTAEVLERLGLRTIEDIAKLPRTTLIRAVGEAAGATLHELAWGRDYRDVAPQDAEKSISAAETFPTDLDNPEEILREYLRLCERATSRLRDKGLFAKTISIKVRFGDFTTINRSKTLPLPIDSTHDVYEVVKGLYEALRIERARLRLVGVSLENLSEGAPVQMMLGEREKGWREAEGAMDKARERFGHGSVRPARLINPSAEDSEE